MYIYYNWINKKDVRDCNCWNKINISYVPYMLTLPFLTLPATFFIIQNWTNCSTELYTELQKGPVTKMLFQWNIQFNNIYQSYPQNLLFPTKYCITKAWPWYQIFKTTTITAAQYARRNVAVTKILTKQKFVFDLDSF